MKSPLPAVFLGLAVLGAAFLGAGFLIAHHAFRTREAELERKHREAEARLLDQKLALARAQEESQAKVELLELEIARLETAKPERAMLEPATPEPAESKPATLEPPAPATPEKKPLGVGQALSPDAIASLGLDESQVVAANRVLEDEERRLTERLAAFYLANVPGADPSATAGKSSKELLVAMFPQLTQDIAKLESLPEETRARLKANEASIESVLGEETFLGRLAREMHGARRDTYGELARWLTADQVGKLREDWLGEGSFRWSGGVTMELGPMSK
jgi:hypothetical protein